MKARQVKALRRKQAARTQQQQVEAAGEFVSTWTELLGSLPADYNCYMTCGEAEAAASLLQAFGEHATAEMVIEEHGQDDDHDDDHHQCTEACR
ncbi:hypothetical protein ACWDFH_26215 [Streptomyces kronopolitis]